ncbi:MAG: abscisic acid-deficient protein Aba4 family protein [Candidatus Thalassarchaeaceae archaeon]
MRLLFAIHKWTDWTLFTGNPLEFFDTMVSLLGTETGTVLAWAHFVAGDIMATRWMWRKGIENKIGINRIRIIVFFGVMLMPVGLLLHVILNRESTATTE